VTGTPEPGPLPHWDEVVVVIAATPWDGIRMSERHVAEHLSHSVGVLWVDPPISWLTPLRRRGAGAALREPRVRLVAPDG
jgi:teichuronic acid biosynthesis glycosyltransferase TuaH